MKIRRYLDASPLYLVYRAYHGVFEPFQTRLQDGDLSFVEALTLAALFFEGRPLRPSELAAEIGVTRSNMSHAIRNLEKQGWLKRTTAANDARVFLLELTAAGSKRTFQVIKVFDTIQDRFERGLSPTKIRALRRLLQRVEAIGSDRSAAKTKASERWTGRT